MNNKQHQKHPLEQKLSRVSDLLGHLIAVQMYEGGASQRDIAKSLRVSLGTVNKFVKGVKAPKEYDKK